MRVDCVVNMSLSVHHLHVGVMLSWLYGYSTEIRV